jgi:hypothetical protein
VAAAVVLVAARAPSPSSRVTFAFGSCFCSSQAASAVVETTAGIDRAGFGLAMQMLQIVDLGTLHRVGGCLAAGLVACRGQAVASVWDIRASDVRPDRMHSKSGRRAHLVHHLVFLRRLDRRVLLCLRGLPQNHHVHLHYHLCHFVRPQSRLVRQSLLFHGIRDRDRPMGPCHASYHGERGCDPPAERRVRQFARSGRAVQAACTCRDPRLRRHCI